MNPVEILAQAPLWSQPPLAIAATVAVFAGFVLVAGAIISDFRRYYRQDRRIVSSDRSLVETGTMTLFFFAYYAVLKTGLSSMQVSAPWDAVLVVFGLVLVVLGVTVNLWGRVELGSGWANQIRVYEGQKLVSSGPFAFVRHPLYASLIWIFVGGAAIYRNPLALFLTLGVFLPMMYVRAKKEDAVLALSFGDEYEAYRLKTGMFFPKPWR